MLLFSFFAAVFWFGLCCHASPTVISDYRVQDPNLTPVLGRGYSMTANQVVSTCLKFTEKTEPTYNYDYDYLEINSEGKTDEKKSGKFGASLSWGFIRATVDASFSSKSHAETKTRSIATRMAMERYYSSVDDTTATLHPDAVELLNRGDIVGFYQACGSGYIRSIRRTAEVSAVFSFESKQLETVMSASASLKVSLFGKGAGKGSFSMDSSSYSMDSSMKIAIKAFGLGLNLNGSHALVATSLEDYHNVLDFAFKSMLNDDVGMVKGIEVVPWIDCLQFQKTIDFSKSLEVVKPDGEIQGVTEDNFKPKMIAPVELKAISTINAEFITAMEAIYRTQMYYYATMARCVGELQLLSNTHPDFSLSDRTRMEFGPERKAIKVRDVAAKLDAPALKTKYETTRNFIEYFYGPCASAIQKYSNNGRMTKYFWELDECGQPHCALTNYEIIVDPSSTSSPGGTSPVAAQPSYTCQLKKTPANSALKGDATDLNAMSVDNIIDRYCMPELDTPIIEK